MPTSNDASYDSVVRYAVPARESAMSVKIYVTVTPMLLPISNDATAHRGVGRGLMRNEQGTRTARARRTVCSATERKDPP